MDRRTPPSPPAASSRVVWCLTDGKPGHLNQLRGLVAALGRRLPLECHTLTIDRSSANFVDALRGRFTPGARLPAPDLIVAAGHATHSAALAARRARGGRAIVLMKPSWGARGFNLCLVPEHDGVPAGGNVVLTRGVLNTVVPSTSQDERRGLVLVGGPSTHHGWSDAALVQRIVRAVEIDRDGSWTLTTSRRTPATFLPALERHPLPNLSVVPLERTTPDWVPSELAAAARVLVTEDSVSMVYESLTAGAAVGLLPVPRLRQSRIVRGLDRLVAEGWATVLDEGRPLTSLRRPPAPLCESERCAELICDRWFGSARRAA